MKIGIDLDGVLLDAYETIKNEYEEYKEKYPDRIAANNELVHSQDHTTILNGNLQDFSHFYELNLEHYYLHGNIQKGAREFIEKLKNEGHELVIITSRTSWDCEIKAGEENIKNMTREWVKKNNLLVDDIVFCKTGSKSKYCIDNNIDVMIDDHIKYVYEVSKIMPAVWFDVNENENAATFSSNYNVYKTHDFNLIFNIINYRLKVA